MKKKEELYSCSQQDHNAMAETDIKMVPIADLHDFEGHPFKVENDMALFELMQSIEKEGVIVPALARPRAEGGYELIAGHRRKAASKWAGLDVMPVVIRELDDNQAVIAMVDSNLQREHLKPSEKAFAYKMKLDAMKRQGARTDLTFCQVGEKLENPTLQTHSLAGGYDADGKWMLLQDKSVEDAIIRSNQSLAMQTGESQRQISRYIRLTNLIPKLLDMVDDGKIAFTITRFIKLRYVDMRETIQNYFEKTKQYPNYYSNEDFSTICDGIKKEIDKGVFLVERKDETDLSVFEEKYGYTLPTEINDYINLFWHPCIRGYCNTKESIVLFSVLKKEGDSSDDILFYENSLISMAKDWEEMDIDGEVEDKPIANSLKELINNMNVNPNIRKKEENKCCL